ELARLEALLRDGARENGELKARATEQELRLRESQLGFQRAAAEAARLDGENGPLRREVDRLRSGVAALEAALAEERSKSEGGAGEAALLRGRLEKAEAALREREAGLDRVRASLAALESAMV